MKNFLTAKWKKLVIANYEVEKELLEKYLPNNTKLDLWNNKCYVSLVGFMFLDTKLLGCKIPYHTNFEEVNLRFYVKYYDQQIWKRGVVFIKEIVPKPALTFVANTIYKEKYHTMPMKHTWLINEETIQIEYSWKLNNNWNTLKIETESKEKLILPESEEEFITEHYWGYTKINNNKTSEYEVEHPKWTVFKTKSFAINVNFNEVYGKEFEILNNLQPKSVFLAEGSEIAVKKGKLI